MSLKLFGLAKRSIKIIASIDTGFNGFLTLPVAEITKLKLPMVGKRKGKLADGSLKEFSIFSVLVEWLGEKKQVLVFEAEGGPLVGMAMLEGNRLIMDVEVGGTVEIKNLNNQ